MFTRVDIILWIFLQNIILLPYEYLLETDEYEIFRAGESRSSKFIISNQDVFDDKRIIPSDFYFDTFHSMIRLLYIVLPENHRKKLLLEKAIPLIDNIYTVHLLENFHL
jgi:hypothetical protein